MPPEVLHCHSLLTPLVKFSHPPSSVSHKNWQGTKRMKVPVRKLIPLCVFILTSFSIFRLLRLAITTSSPSPSLRALQPTSQHMCPSASLSCSSDEPGISSSSTGKSPAAEVLTEKEFRLLSDLIAHKAPCNLLIFGLEPQYLALSSINARGITVFLEDDPGKITANKVNSNMTRVYKVEYHMPAKKAYKLLKQARQNPACAPNSGLSQQSKCQLALTELPREVNEMKWDVVVVDGPSGNGPDAPGRMATIYTAGVVARAGNTTHVLVHDVHRTIERWFSWEFLCEENLVSSKGKLWNFKLTGQSNSTRFCSPTVVLIE